MAECKHDWIQLDGFYALTKVEKVGGQTNFIPTFGVPVEVSVCKVCFEVKLVAAIAKGSFK